MGSSAPSENDNQFIILNVISHFFSILIVRFFTEPMISMILEVSSQICFMSSVGLGFSLSFTVFSTIFSNSLLNELAASIYKLESPIHTIFVRTFRLMLQSLGKVLKVSSFHFSYQSGYCSQNMFLAEMMGIFF